MQVAMRTEVVPPSSDGQHSLGTRSAIKIKGNCATSLYARATMERLRLEIHYHLTQVTFIPDEPAVHLGATVRTRSKNSKIPLLVQCKSEIFSLNRPNHSPLDII
jgi:hypothetical protein